MKNKDVPYLQTQIKQHVKRIVWLLFFVSVIIFVVGYFEAQAMNAVRAYVRGEGLWAKAQRDAVMQLYQYLGDPKDATYAAFEQALQVNLEDKRARLALQQPVPDRASARAGFLAARNHPDDVDNMIRLFLWFGNVQPMKRAIDIWTEADQQVDELLHLASRIRSSHPASSLAVVSEHKRALDAVNRKLNDLEIAFSDELSQGARWMGDVFVWVNFSLLGSLLAVVGWITRRVIREIDQTESDLRDSEMRFKTLYNSNLIGIVCWGKEGRLFDVNDAFLNILGYTRADFEAGILNWMNITPPESKPADDIALQQIAALGYCIPYYKEYIHKAGHRVAVFIAATTFDGLPDHGLAFVVDRTNEKKMDSQLRLAATVLDASLDGILIADHNNKILTVNDAYCTMTGYRRAELIGMLASFGQFEGASGDALDIAMLTDGCWQGDTAIQIKSGDLLPVRTSVNSVKNEAGDVTHYVAVFTDISVRQALEAELKNMAHFDHLTGLANRNLFMDRLDTALFRAQRSKKKCGLLFVDLNKFKPINDQFGHAAGDRVLQQVAARLKSVMRESDTIGRIGGDEFVAIIEGLDQADASIQVAQKMIDQLKVPFMVDEHSLSVGCSIGISVYPSHGETGVDLMRAADIAMYAAKASASTHYYVFSNVN